METRSKRSRRIRSEANPPPSMISKIGADPLLETLIRLPNPRFACPTAVATRRKRSRQIRSVANPPPSMISKIGDDPLLEILIRLPNPRSACRCKAVCKRWRSLISDHRFNSRFVSHHQSLNKRQTLLLHTDDASDLQSVIMSFIPPMPDRVRECFKVLDCYKDLLLCGFADLLENNNEIGRSYVVCNPFTKQWMALPLAPEKPVGYQMPVTRLVCEPRSSKCNYKLELGDDQVFAYSEYRFRVVCIYQHDISIKLDVFCPESGKWTKEAAVYDGFRRVRHRNVCVCNGELFWLCVEAEPGSEELNVDYEFDRYPELNPFLAVFDPFRFDVHSTRIEVLEYTEDLKMDISVSQGALHIIEFEKKPTHARLRVWRLDDDHEYWTDLCEGLLERPSKCNYEIKYCKILDLHPEKPEVVFFQYISHSVDNDAILCRDLRKGELEFFADLRQLTPRWTVFQPRISCWPTPIPRYEELQGMYDGSFCWFKAANNISLNSASEQKAAAPLSKKHVAPLDVICDVINTLLEDWTHKMMWFRDSVNLRACCDAMRKLHAELEELQKRRNQQKRLKVINGGTLIIRV